jgi:hypothetical protein
MWSRNYLPFRSIRVNFQFLVVGVRVARSLFFCIVFCQFVLFIFFIALSVLFFYLRNRIDGVIVIVLASSMVDRGFESRAGQSKDYKIGSCCFSAKHAALRRKSKDWLARTQDNVSEWGDMFYADCCFDRRRARCCVTKRNVNQSILYRTI